MSQFRPLVRGPSLPRVATAYSLVVAFCVCTMQRLAAACLVGPGPYPTALALMAHYDRRPKKIQWARLVESEETKQPNDPEQAGNIGSGFWVSFESYGLSFHCRTILLRF